MWGKGKTGLLPKDLAARAEKLAPEKVEAEVRRIVSAKPATPTPAPGAIMLPGLQAVPAWDAWAQYQGLQQAQQAWPGTSAAGLAGPNLRLG